MKCIALLTLIIALPVFTGCSKLSEKWAYLQHLNHKAEIINNYERTALELAKENREFQIKISDLEYQVQQLKTQKKFLSMQVEKESKGEEKSEAGRKIASVAPPADDLVKQDIFKWTPEQLIATADKEFEEKHYEKAAQFYKTMIDNFPSDKSIDEELLFQAGLASFESSKYEWTMENMALLMKKYPNSKYYRGAKLWTALTQLKLGKKKEFFSTVEEFRSKYRNTQEWTILSAHYEKIIIDKYSFAWTKYCIGTVMFSLLEMEGNDLKSSKIFADKRST